MKHTYTSSQVASPFRWQRRLPITRLLWIIVFLFFVNIKAEGQTVYSFPTTPTWIPYPGVPSWIQTAEVTIDGVVYQISNAGNGSWEHKSTGGNSTSTSLYFATAADMIITIKRKDGQRFQFYDVWLKYTNIMGGLYQPPWLEVTYSGSSKPNETYGANTTTHLTNKNVSVTEVRLKYSGLLELNLDDLKVGPALPEANSAPTNITLSKNDVNENVAAGTAIGTLSTTDPDAGDTFTYSFVTGTGSTDNASFSLTGNTLKINASPDYETKSSYSVRIRSTDSRGESFEKAFVISVMDVNEAPVLASIGNKTVNEGNELTFIATATDADVPANILTYSLVGAGIPNGANINAETGVFKWTPTELEGPGVYTFVVRVSDGALKDEEQITVTVNEVNVAPVAADDSYTTNEDTQLTQSAPGVLTNDTDSDLPTQALTVSLVTNTIHGTLNLNANGSFTYMPHANFNGTDSFTYRANDGTLSSDVATVTITVNSINDAPTITGTPATSVNQDAAYSFIPVANDVDGNSLVFTIANKPSWATFNTATGALTGTPANADVGTTTGIVITVSDGMASASLPAFNLTVTTKVFVGLTLSAETFGYDGTVKRLQVAGTHVPEPTVTYENQERTIAGSQQVKATLTALGYTPLVLTAQLTVNPAILTVIADAKSKVYGDADPGLTYTATGFKGSDTQQTVMTGALSRGAGENVGSYVIGRNTVSAGGNYSITYTAANLGITPAALTVKADAKSKVYGSTDPTLTYQITAGKLIGSDKLTGNLSRVSGENVGTYSINQGTLNASTNYDFTYKNANFEITKAGLTITADAKSKVYGTNDPSLTYQITAGQLIGSDVLTGNLSRVSGENVGIYSINQGSLAASENYNFTYQKADFEITKAGLTVTADSKSKVYGSTDPALTYQITAGQLIGSDKLTGNLSRVSGENVGTYAINQGTLNASSNYDFTYQKADFDITKASLTVTADSKSKVYGSTDPALTYQITAGQLIGSDVLTGALARDTGENVRTYSINQGTLNASANYTLTYQNANFDITKASLTVTADPQSKVYGTNDPSLTYQITSGKLVGIDQLTGALVRDAGENVGDYPITQGTLSASPNYDFTYQKADLAITPASLVVTADAKSKVYGTNDPSLTYQITSGKLVGIDQLTGALERDSGENVGNYPITQGTLAASTNYDFTYQKADLEITPASLVVTADAKSKVYGTNDPSLTYQITSGQLIGNDKLTGTLTRDAGEDVGTYTINQGTLTASSNYDFIFNKADFDITKASLTITADAKSKVYGTNDPVLTYQITSGKLIGSDVLSGAIARDTGENVGNYTINQGTLNASSNYDFIFNKADFDITKAGLTVTADAKSKVYGSTDPTLTYQITAGKLIGSDKLTGNLSRVSGENVGTYTINQGTLTASSNYDFIFNKADFDITKASLTITADAKSKVYGTNDPALTYQITSGQLIGSDVLIGALARDTGENVGNYTINQGTLNASPNYELTYKKADFDITKAGLTITADPKSKVYGTNDPALTYQITSGQLIGSDVLTGALARDTGENVGNYTINQGTLNASSNYTLTYQNADFEITKATVNGITFNDDNFTYDGTAKSLAILGSLPKGTTVNYVNNDQSQAGTYTVTANIIGGNNYENQTLKAILTINKATQVITWTQDLTIGCDGENTLVLNATASSGLPIHYTSSNSTIAAVIGNSLTFNKQGFADITAQQDGNNNYLPATHVIKQVSMRLIGKVKKKWEDVLIFDNSSDDFVSWQWYKDGQAIVGAQGQYYTSPTPLNGSYMVVVKDKDGNTMETCPLVIVAGQHKGGVKVVPNPARQGTTFTIKADYPSEELKGAKIMITDITGKLNKEINQVSPEVVTQVPMVPGVYIIYLFLENGKRESVKLLVN
ncbi:MBG domain-containing protein [Empedobacter falsenii]|uniref:Tandem-95 repeat protein n=1 Tax=Empedobacter falsenii TaxID=343874 RepID=A0AAW7DKP0_9FLAO|nr:MBG domain-containing protein [Empedobacter falsenii]MDM1551662.1 tandem-95 repeat protein [Empedobacter falsenii]